MDSEEKKEVVTNSDSDAGSKGLVLPELNEEALIKALEKVNRNRGIHSPEPNHQNKDTGTVCAIPGCGGQIFNYRELVRTDVPVEMFVMGEGGPPAYKTIYQLACERCGILYHHLPKSRLEEVRIKW